MAKRTATPAVTRSRLLRDKSRNEQQKALLLGEVSLLRRKRSALLQRESVELKRALECACGNHQALAKQPPLPERAQPTTKHKAS